MEVESAADRGRTDGLLGFNQALYHTELQRHDFMESRVFHPEAASETESRARPGLARRQVITAQSFPA